MVIPCSTLGLFVYNDDALSYGWDLPVYNPSKVHYFVGREARDTFFPDINVQPLPRICDVHKELTN